MTQTFVSNHPYYPVDVEIPLYMPNASSVVVLLASFSSIIGITLLLTLVISKRINPDVSISEQALICWFGLCGFLHCFFEGYFILNHKTMAGSQDLFAQLWKEYALSDSRYLTSDPFVLSVEAITVAAWGPLCWATVISIVRGSGLRYPLQIIVCLAHLYGVALYYSTCTVEYVYRGHSHSRPETLYFWVYYVGFNMPWAVIPAIILADSLKTLQRVFAAFGKLHNTLKAANLPGATHESKKAI